MTIHDARPATSTRPAATAETSLLHQLGRDSAYLLSGLPLAMVSCTVLLGGLLLGLGLLITGVGVPVLVLALECGRWFAVVERRRVEQVSGERVAVIHRPAVDSPNRLRHWFERLRDRQAWLDLAHGVLSLPVATATWSLTVVWWCGALGGLTYWIWSPALPNDGSSQDLNDLIDLPWADWITPLLIGGIFAVTLIPVLRLCVAVQAFFARAVLGGSRDGQLKQRIVDLTESRSAAAQAEVDSLRRLERDIHDGPQQRLVRLGMDLAAIQRQLAHKDVATAARIVEEASAQTAEALSELRALTRGIAPPILVDRGLPAALTALADRCGVASTVQVSLPQRYAAPIETAAYFVASEALTNVAKHSAATEVTLRTWVDDAQMTLEVVDNGCGGASFDKGRGLAGLAERVAALDGQLTVDSPDAGPTTVRAVIPCG
ncbi:MAG: sensor histidine kinase [Ornithinimicrobium sp.]